MQTTSPHGYLPPPDSEIKVAATTIGLKLDAPEFIRDVCTIRAKGEFKNPAQLTAEINKLMDRNPIRRSVETDDRGGKSTKRTVFVDPNTGGKFDTLSAATDCATKHFMDLSRQITDAIQMLPSLEVPGGSPMHEAINLLKLLAEQQGKNSSEGGEGGENNFLQKLLSKQNLQQAKDNLDMAKGMSASERETLQQVSKLKKQSEQGEDGEKNGKKKSPAESDKKSDGTETGDTAGGKAVIDAAVALTDKQMQQIVKVARRLKALSKLKTSKITKFSPDVQGDQVQNRSMRDFNELGRVKSSDLGMMSANKPLFMYRAATAQLQIRERGIHTEKKQLLYMIVDCSGSMGGEGSHRINLAGGVLVNRLMAVAKGDATLYWRFFDTRLYECHYVASKDEAYGSIQTILNVGNYAGGGTNFDNALQGAVDHIGKLRTDGGDFIKPEIMIVTDGECECRMKYSDLHGIKLHTALVADCSIQALESLTTQSGGLFMRLTH